MNPTVFIAELVALLLAGRILGELSHRLGQPVIMGQLLAGIALGPSVLGALWPGAEQWLFPASAAQRGMLDAVAQLGVLMLLLLTGMETDLSIVNRVRRSALLVSFFGVAVPFVAGLLLGKWLPAALLPDSHRRLLTALFLGVALAISSVKIVASVIRELRFTHRRAGVVLLAAAVLDDTIGWIILAAIFSLARQGELDLQLLASTLLATALFLLLSFTVGKRGVATLIRWSNDQLQSEMAVVTTILIVMGLFALATDALGLHTVLGAFVAGMLVGKSPLLTKHIYGQLRGPIAALFMPVFFGLAGLSADLSVLRNPTVALWAVIFILVASIGKFTGALLGGRLGGLSLRESTAIGCGMNARGSTEVIIATLGLKMGALSPTLFTLIVLMAFVTTLVMPSTLRASLRRIPLTDDEQKRLAENDFRKISYVAGLERLLVAVDTSHSGRLAARLVGLMSGSHSMPTTVVPLNRVSPSSGESVQPVAVIKAAVDAARDTVGSGGDSAPDVATLHVTSTPSAATTEHVIAKEAVKGFNLLWIGVDPVMDEVGAVNVAIRQAVEGFDGSFAIAVARGGFAEQTGATVSAKPGPLNILLAVTGTAYSQRGAELALALAQASAGTVTALYVDTADDEATWSSGLAANLRARRHGATILQDVVELGRHYDLAVFTRARRSKNVDGAILAEIAQGGFNLLVLGVTRRSDDALFFGPIPAILLAKAPESLLLIAT